MCSSKNLHFKIFILLFIGTLLSPLISTLAECIHLEATCAAGSPSPLAQMFFLSVLSGGCKDRMALYLARENDTE